MLTETQELKSCPFCGSDVVEINRYDGGWGVNCLTECCMGNVAPDEQRWDERGSAIRSWNTRPSPTAGGVEERIMKYLREYWPRRAANEVSEEERWAADILKDCLSTLTTGAQLPEKLPESVKLQAAMPRKDCENDELLSAARMNHIWSVIRTALEGAE